MPGHRIILLPAAPCVAVTFTVLPTSNGTIFPSLAAGAGDDTDNGTNARGRFVPSVGVDQFGATLASWFGVSNADLPGVFPNINNFTTKNLGFMA